MKKLLFTLSFILSIALNAQTISPAGWMRFKRVLTAGEVNGSFTTPISLLAAPGSGKIIYVDPHSVAIDMSTGTAFDFAASFIKIGDYGGGTMIVCQIDHSSFNGNSWLNPGFTWTITNDAAAFVFDGSSSNAAVYFWNDADDGSAGTRTVTITFNYCILNLN